MAQFNLNDYETVETRLRLAHAAHDDLRIVTVNHTTAQDRQSSMWVVEARIYLSAGDQAHDLPKATGWAFEIDGAGMANKTSALENCETSAIGRALANMNFSGNKRASREEMTKVAAGVTPITAKRDWLGALAEVTTEEQAKELWGQARQSNAPESVLQSIKAKGKALAGTQP